MPNGLVPPPTCTGDFPAAAVVVALCAPHEGFSWMTAKIDWLTMTDLINLRVNFWTKKKTLCHGETAASVLEDLLLCYTSYTYSEAASRCATLAFAHT